MLPGHVRVSHLFRPGKAGLVWDDEWSPEGLGLAWNNGRYFVNALGTWLESDNNKEAEFVLAMQAGFSVKLFDQARLTAGIAYHQFDRPVKEHS